MPPVCSPRATAPTNVVVSTIAAIATERDWTDPMAPNVRSVRARTHMQHVRVTHAATAWNGVAPQVRCGALETSVHALGTERGSAAPQCDRWDQQHGADTDSCQSGAARIGQIPDRRAE